MCVEWYYSDENNKLEKMLFVRWNTGIFEVNQCSASNESFSIEKIRGKCQDISQLNRARVVDLHQKALLNHQIAQRVDIPRTPVWRIVFFLIIIHFYEKTSKPGELRFDNRWLRFICNISFGY